MTKRLSTKLSRHGLTRQMEAFCRLVVNEQLEPTEAVKHVYSDTSYPSSYAGELMLNPKVTRRIGQLQERRDLVASLNRKEYIADAMEIQQEARTAGKHSAAISAVRLAAEIDGVLSTNPIAEQTVAFLQFLAGTSPVVEGDVRVLDAGTPGSS